MLDLCLAADASLAPLRDDLRRLENYAVAARYPALLLAKACDFLIVYRSTYAVDAFALDKTVICLYDHWERNLEEYRTYQVFRYASGTVELCREISRALQFPVERKAEWVKAKQECLNEGHEDPARLITQILLEGAGRQR